MNEDLEQAQEYIDYLENEMRATREYLDEFNILNTGSISDDVETLIKSFL